MFYTFSQFYTFLHFTRGDEVGDGGGGGGGGGEEMVVMIVVVSMGWGWWYDTIVVMTWLWWWHDCVYDIFPGGSHNPSCCKLSMMPAASRVDALCEQGWCMLEAARDAQLDTQSDCRADPAASWTLTVQVHETQFEHMFLFLLQTCVWTRAAICLNYHTWITSHCSEFQMKFRWISEHILNFIWISEKNLLLSEFHLKFRWNSEIFLNFIWNS